MSPAPPTLAPAPAPSVTSTQAPHPAAAAEAGRREGDGMEIDDAQPGPRQGQEGAVGPASGGSDGESSVHAAVAVAVAALRPFAVVDEVTEGSPAATAGIQVCEAGVWGTGV